MFKQCINQRLNARAEVDLKEKVRRPRDKLLYERLTRCRNHAHQAVGVFLVPLLPPVATSSPPTPSESAFFAEAVSADM